MFRSAMGLSRWDFARAIRPESARFGSACNARLLSAPTASSCSTPGGGRPGSVHRRDSDPYLHFHPAARAAQAAAVLQSVLLKGALRAALTSAVNAARCDPSRDSAPAFPTSCDAR